MRVPSTRTYVTSPRCALAVDVASHGGVTSVFMDFVHQRRLDRRAVGMFISALQGSHPPPSSGPYAVASKVALHCAVFYQLMSYWPGTQRRSGGVCMLCACEMLAAVRPTLRLWLLAGDRA